MTYNNLAFKDTGYFSSLICNYLSEDESLKQLYNRFPNIENFKLQIEEKQASFQLQTRQVLAEALKQQYQNISASEATLQNIEILKNENTFTVTTGHQLNLFTGPLYFLYKIVSAINLAKQLKDTYPEYNFVPVYWMATEDHDFDEINYFNYKGKKIQYNRAASGAVGELSNEGLEDVFKVFSSELGISDNAKHLKQLFKHAYLKHNNLAEATLYLANELFKDYGLVIVEANNKQLKQLFTPFVKTELVNQTSYKAVTETSKALSSEPLNYNVQVNPREINLFYLKENLRERIIFEDNIYKVNNTEITFTKDEILKELETNPERFSPNVIMRPLYQEVILPNLCYIGGGGELAYWFQLQSYFNAVNIPFPMLLLRNSVLIQTEKQTKKLEKLGVSLTDRFLKQEQLIKNYTKKLSEVDIDFSTQKEHLKQQFKALHELAAETDASFKNAVNAQERKQIKGLEHLEKRLLKAQKRKFSEELSRLKDLQNQLFPNQSLQERQVNFSEFYEEYGGQLISTLINTLEPLKGEFTVITL